MSHKIQYSGQKKFKLPRLGNQSSSSCDSTFSAIRAAGRSRSNGCSFFERLEDRTLMSSVVVNSTADTDSAGAVTLRDALAIANSSTTPTTITFNPTVFSTNQTITLGGTQLELSNTNQPTTITGPAAGVTFSGNNLSRVFVIDTGVTVGMSNVTITSGNCVNDPDQYGYHIGGGIDNINGFLTMTDCTVTDCMSGGAGGIQSYPQSGSVDLTDVTISNNNGGNSAPGGINCTASTLTNVTIIGNTAALIGGGFAGKNDTLIGCTITGNTAGTGGGGLYVNALTLSIGNTIIEGNTCPAGSPDVGISSSNNGTITSLGHNLIGKTDGSTGWLSSDLTGTIAAPLNADLGSLGNNGGLTQTVLPQAGSPAIAAGSVGLIPSGVTTDQRGYARTSNGTVDIGAVEEESTTVVGPASLVVNTTSDTATGSGVETLRDAIVTANSSTTPTTITFDPTVFATAQTITLGGTQLELTNTGDATTITGPSAGITISGDGTSRVFIIDKNVTANFQGISVIDGHTVNTSAGNGGIANGSTVGSGGGILNLGTVTFDGGSISGNSSGDGGGGIENASTLTMSNTTVSHNVSEGHGGGVENYGNILGQATATLTGVVVEDNTTTDSGGGGIASDTNGSSGETTLTLNNVTVTGNSTPFNGGGVLIDSSNVGDSLTGLTASGNTAAANGGGIALTGGSATVTDSSVISNAVTTIGSSRGGGIFNAGTLTISDTTLNANTTPFYGGAVDNEGGVLTMTDDTVINNTEGSDAVNDGMNGTASLEGLTVTGNTTTGGVPTIGGAVAVDYDYGAALTIGNSIITGNASTASAGPDVWGAFISNGHNLIGATEQSTGWVSSDYTGTAASPLSAGLGALAGNGGPTQTLLPQAGSLAIGHGSLSLIPSGITTDQRGDPRTIDGAVDIGAVEVGGASSVLGAQVSVTSLSVEAQTLVVGQSNLFTVKVASSGAGGATPTGTVTFYSNGVAAGTYTLVNGQVQEPITADTAGTASLSAFYSGDTNYTSSTSATITQTYLPASTAVGKVTTSKVPTSAIIGQKYASTTTVGLTNQGPKLKGDFLEQLYLDAAAVGLSSNPTQILSKLVDTTLATGRKLAASFVTHLLPTSVLAGTYHLVAKITDPLGNVDLITLANTVTVAAPVVVLSASAAAVKPSTIAVGKSASVVVSVTNSGNINAVGTLTITLAPSTDGTTAVPGVTLATLSPHVTLKPGKAGKYTLHFKVPASLAAGKYYPVFSVQLDGVSANAVGASAFDVT